MSWFKKLNPLWRLGRKVIKALPFEDILGMIPGLKLAELLTLKAKVEDAIKVAQPQTVSTGSVGIDGALHELSKAQSVGFNSGGRHITHGEGEE